MRQAGRAESPVAKIDVIPFKKVGGQMPGSGISWPESRRLGAQCSILVVIAGIVSWLIAT